MPVIRDLKNSNYPNSKYKPNLFRRSAYNQAEGNKKTSGGHKIWLMIGIILVILAVLFVVFYPTIRENLFGKTIRYSSFLTERYCDNGRDDDYDIKIDCDDSDCSTDAACLPPESDLDGDGILNSNEAAACINKGIAGRVSQNGCYYGDSDNNGCLSPLEYNDFKIDFVTGIYTDLDIIKYNDHKIDFINNANNIRCSS